MTSLLASRTPAACTAEAIETTIGESNPCPDIQRGGLCLRDAHRPHSKIGTYQLDSYESSCGRLQDRSVLGAHRRPRGRNLGADTLRRRWLLRTPTSATRVEDGFGWRRLADESVDAVALDEGLRERPLRVVVWGVELLAGSLLVLNSVAA